MLYRNRKTGNTVYPKDPATAEMMARSSIYEAIRTKPPDPVPKAAKQGKKPAQQAGKSPD